MKQWIVVLSVLVIGAIGFVWWFDTPEQPVVTTAQIAEPVVQKEQSIMAKPKSVEPSEPSIQEVDLMPFADLRGIELNIALVRSIPNLTERVDVLLALIEEQHLGINEPLEWIVGNEIYTPIWMAFEISRGTITTEQFQRFLDLGATLQRNDYTEDVIGFVMNKDILATWYDETGLGPEDHQAMFDQALIRGNADLAELVWEDKGGRFDQVHLSESAVQSYLREYRSVKPADTDKLLDSLKNFEYGDSMLEAFIAHQHGSIARIEMLKEYGDLTLAERNDLDNAKDLERSNLVAMEEVLVEAREHFAKQAKVAN
ncbi:hypothetical protein [Pseudidiomarina aestuarii]|uniref:hypothetical protein n=1 Tax=Pseudidiomarina aestuarii TaxID=624146 RepID=UPI003A97AA8E